MHFVHFRCLFPKGASSFQSLGEAFGRVPSLELCFDLKLKLPSGTFCAPRRFFGQLLPFLVFLFHDDFFEFF